MNVRAWGAAAWVGFFSLTAVGCEDDVDVTRDPSATGGAGGVGGAAGSAGEPTAGAEPAESGGGSPAGAAGAAGSDEPTAGAEPGEASGGSPAGGVGNGGGAPGGAGTAGSAGDPGSDAGGRGPLEPSEVTRAADCEYAGNGGANGYYCTVATIEFVPSLPLAGIAATVTTSLGDTYELDESGPILGEVSAEDARMSFVVEDGAVLGLLVVDDGFAQPRYAPTWIDLELSQDSALLVDQRLTPSYHCEALTIDDWCWMSEPVTVTTSE